MEEEPVSAIRFEQVSLQFHAPRLAVNDCSCEVEAGQLVILGPSGCGKTTLLKMVNRLYEPTAGKIYLDGTDSADESYGTAPADWLCHSAVWLVSTHDGCSEHCCCAEVAGAGREQKSSPR